MVDIQSKEIIDKISDELKIQPSLNIPRQLGKEIQLNYVVNPPQTIRFIAGALSDGTTLTIHTTHPTKRTFLVGMNLTVSKDASSTSTSSDINVRLPSQSSGTDILTIRYEPSTAGSFTETVTFPFPIELDLSSLIRIQNSNGTASIDTTAQIFFYETDPQ